MFTQNTTAFSFRLLIEKRDADKRSPVGSERFPIADTKIRPTNHTKHTKLELGFDALSPSFRIR